MNNIGLEEAAISVIRRAIAFDNEGRVVAALASYQEGIQLFLDLIKRTKNDKEKLGILRQKTEEYITRAELVKNKIEEKKDAGNYHEQIHIPYGAARWSYAAIFNKYIDKSMERVEIDDSYIRTVRQAENFCSFCELLVKNCPNLKQIRLETGIHQEDFDGQKSRLISIRQSLTNFDVELVVNYSKTLHDREIRFDNGWIIKIGRGLDIFRPVPKFTIGHTDQALRPTFETTVDIFFKRPMEG